MDSILRLNLALKYHYAEMNDEAWRIVQDLIARPEPALDALSLAVTLRLTAAAFDDVVDICRRILARESGNTEAWNNLGHALDQLARPDEAIAAYENAIAIGPTDAAPHNNLGVVLSGQGRFTAAATAFGRALTLDLTNIAATVNSGVALVECGDVENGLAQFAKALALDPLNKDAHDNRLFALHNTVDDPAVLFAQHRAWAQSFERAGGEPTEGINRDPSRKLRIGYVSPDFRQHSVGFFIEALLKCHDRRHFDVFCYSQVALPDATTAQFKALAGQWRELRGLSTDAAVAVIRGDQIDILIDLAGHTMGNRLDVFAARAAPLQLTAIGYPGTTGLSTFDGRLSDGIADLQEHDFASSESLVRIPGGMHCYSPPVHAPVVGPLPSQDRGYITFGSFNKLAKISPATIQLWAQVLAAVPNSRLLIKTKPLAEDKTRESLLARFSAAGIGAERLDLRGWDPDDRGHLGTYNLVDVGLDTFPYNGTTTTCEALWIGVPVITLAGRTHASRVGASLLTSLGMPDLICDTPQQFVARACALVADRAHLSSLRMALRQRAAASRLCDAISYTQSVEATYRKLWAQYCALG